MRMQQIDYQQHIYADLSEQSHAARLLWLSVRDTVRVGIACQCGTWWFCTRRDVRQDSSGIRCAVA